MNLPQQPPRATDPARRRGAQKIGPGQRGAVKQARAHDDAAIYVRYRENQERTERLTAVEPVVERAVIQKRDDPVVAFKIEPEELELRRLANGEGPTYDGKSFMRELQHGPVLRIGLKHRFAVRPGDFYQELSPI